MAALPNSNPTLLDLAQSLDPKGNIAFVIEILDQENAHLQDMTFVEGNLPTGHVTTIRSGLPEGTWRKINEGVVPTKSLKTQITTNAGQLADYSEVDVKLAKMSGDIAAYRLQEDAAHMEGNMQKHARYLFYGNETTENEAITGFSPYFNDLTAQNASNIINAQGTGSECSSIWLVVWSPTTVYGIVPKGSTAGLQMQDLGEQTVYDVNGVVGTRMQAYQTYYSLDTGLVVADWRYVSRIVNIQRDALTISFAANTNTFATGADLPDLLFQAMRRIPRMSKGRAVFYMSLDMASWVARQAAAKGWGSFLSRDTLGGDQNFVERFHGIPIKRVDALAVNETAIS